MTSHQPKPRSVPAPAAAYLPGTAQRTHSARTTTSFSSCTLPPYSALDINTNTLFTHIPPSLKQHPAPTPPGPAITPPANADLELGTVQVSPTAAAALALANDDADTRKRFATTVLPLCLVASALLSLLLLYFRFGERDLKEEDREQEAVMGIF
ncbi:hypothetical protein B0A50_02083 [Salinomyces thailandicus]|uniref:Uncharacterized protein n=1 Tax=Salinomyces thailandicus TaxID=706561 RepID=A0A4U0U7T3_9PEZI|nr:hypothetical protein B0A50_02083 [Salinomyces thailandica]